MKRITILGATGSIGRNSFQVIRDYPNDFKIIGLSTHHRVDLLYEQCLQCKPEMVCITGKDFPIEFFDKIEQLGIAIATGKEGLEELASRSDVDILVNGIVGVSALHATLAAIDQNVAIALANKEILVMAGEIITSSAAKKGVKILPVDSEHSAIFQCLQGENHADIHRLILTASGGPFQKFTPEQLADVTLAQALKHPNWSMGNKITIDSATLMNKGLEVIEAHWLFQIPVSQIEIVIHPESIIHSMVEFVDGAIKAQMSIPDMKIAIQYALTYPDRKFIQNERLMFNLTKKLTFEPPDFRRFPACTLAYEAIKIGGTAPAVLNAANEEAVKHFIQQKIKFTSIIKLGESALYNHQSIPNPGLDDILAADIWARNFVNEAIQKDEVLVVAF
jgi:1-deoxy-D-xylulose-5-phosphate reductoisomerase